jgi:broad specificity phosphatase PhoE
MRETFPPIYVLRHGETEWNREDRLQGHLDSPLTALGRGQAADQNAILRRHLPEGATAISSDSGRSVETARRALEGLNLPLRYDPRLREVALGDWQGLTIAEVERGWGFLTDGRDPFAWKFDAPGGENLAVFAARARAVLEGLTGPTVIFTHGMTSRVLRCIALGLPPEELGALPGGQGVVHAVENGAARVLTA